MKIKKLGELSWMVLGSFVLLTLGTWLSGCHSNSAAVLPDHGNSVPGFTENTFFGPPRIIPVSSRAGGLVLGDRILKRVQARHVLAMPPSWEAPEVLDNSGYCTALKNQGQTPLCAAYSGEQMLSASFWRVYHHPRDFPVEEIYKTAKLWDGLPAGSQGTTLEGIIRAIKEASLGVTNPVIDVEFIVSDKDIPFACHKFGLVLVALDVTRGWERLNRDGTIGPDTTPMGGHAVLVSGYNLKTGMIWGPNWWGRSWGRNGFWMMTLAQFKAQFYYGYGIRVIWPDPDLNNVRF